MKRIAVILLCLTCLIGLADRRGQIMSQRSVAAGGSFPTPPTSTGPGIWLDVIQEVTNSFSNNDPIIITTNYGFMGGYFLDNSTPPLTNQIYQTASGGYITGFGSPGFQWFTNGISGNLSNGISGNNQCYFQSNYGTVAIRMNYAVDDLSGGFIQTGTTGPTGPGPGYFYSQIVSGTWYFDWGQPGVNNRISKAAPADGLGQWLNVVYVKSNDIMQIWIAGTNWLQGSGQTASLFPTNNYAGSCVLMARDGIPSQNNFKGKRILMWRYALTPSEIAALDTWMTAMP